MSQKDDNAFHSERARQERLLAESAKGKPAKRAHLDLAALHTKALVEESADPTEQAA